MHLQCYVCVFTMSLASLRHSNMRNVIQVKLKRFSQLNNKQMRLFHENPSFQKEKPQVIISVFEKIEMVSFDFTTKSL